MPNYVRREEINRPKFPRSITYLLIIFLLFLCNFLEVKSVNAQLSTNCTTKPDGDANCDAKIDLQDFEYWRREFSGELNSKNADFDTSGQVDLVDFETWRRSIIKSISTPSPQISPPPATLAATIAPFTTDFGTYNPKGVPVELQTFFTPRPDNGRGMGSLHILCKWPLGQKIIGIIKTNCRISLHNNPSTLRLLRFDLNPGAIIKKIELGNKSCPYDGTKPAVCVWNVPVELDSSNWKKGWRHLRVRATLQTVTEDGLKNWVTGSELPFLIGSSGEGEDDDDLKECQTNCFAAQSSYEGKNDDRIVLIKNIPQGKIKGTYIFQVSPGKIENPPSRRLTVYLDKNYNVPAVAPWPQETASNGNLLLDLPNPDPKKIYPITINTNGLTNGWHSLSVGTVGTRPEKAKCRYCDDTPNYQSAVGKLWFYVENDVPTTEVVGFYL